MLRRCRAYSVPHATFFAKNIVDKSTPGLAHAAAVDKVFHHGQSKDGTAPYMIEVDYDKSTGWGKPVLRDFGTLSVGPQIGGLHYGLSCFEDFNVLRNAKGRCRMFRPDYHMDRFQKSCERMALDSTFDKSEFFDLLTALVKANAKSIPIGERESLRLRATMIGNNKSLSAGAADEFKLYIAGAAVDWTPPVPFKAVVGSLNLRRTWKGSTGDHNVSSNFINHIYAESLAETKGYDTVLFISDGERINSLGGSNVIVVIVGEDGKRRLVTPPLDGTIIAGTTRDSVMKILADYGKLPMEERHVTVDELQKLLEEGHVEEIIACGGDHVLSNVTSIAVRGKEYNLPEKMFFHISETFHKQLLKYAKDHPEWSVEMCKAEA